MNKLFQLLERVNQGATFETGFLVFTVQNYGRNVTRLLQES